MRPVLQGGLTCVDRECGCASGTRCGTQYVDTQTSRNHCGGCDDACTGNQACSGGECVDPPECSVAADCLRFNGNWALECVNNRCVCARSDEGYCESSSGGRSCHVCCPGGSGRLRDHVCRFIQTPFPTVHCRCPTGYETCLAGLSHRCSQNRLTDIYRRGTDCTDCTTANPGSRCCNGECMRGCNPGELCFSQNQPCGPNCLPCTDGQICCNSGPNTPGGCVNPIGAGACPL